MGIERRRHWDDEDRLRLLAEIDRPGSKVSEVAGRHDASRGLVWQWRRDLRDGRPHEAGSRHFMPLLVGNSLSEQPVGPAAGALIEITPPDGACLRVGPDVDAAALRRVLSAPRR